MGFWPQIHLPPPWHELIRQCLLYVTAWWKEEQLVMVLQRNNSKKKGEKDGDLKKLAYAMVRISISKH